MVILIKKNPQKKKPQKKTMSQEDNLLKNDENFNFEAKFHVLYENKRF